ncbi:MAG: LuxR family transcriptional regulator [Gammaproteobacteria bacterium]
MQDEHSTFEGRLIPALIIVFSLIAVLVVIDILADISEGTAPGHVAVEAGIGVVAILGVALMVWRVVGVARSARLRADALVADLESSRQDAAEWRSEAQDLLRGLGAKIDSQFEKWKLTPAEKEVALLLLKGFSHKDVARLRSVSETTARQQARGIYRKAGIAGRHDLAGFFLEDLVLPPS